MMQHQNQQHDKAISIDDELWLPNDMVQQIGGYLLEPDLRRAQRVSRQFRYQLFPLVQRYYTPSLALNYHIKPSAKNSYRVFANTNYRYYSIHSNADVDLICLSNNRIALIHDTKTMHYLDTTSGHILKTIQDNEGDWQLKKLVRLSREHFASIAYQARNSLNGDYRLNIWASTTGELVKTFYLTDLSEYTFIKHLILLSTHRFIWRRNVFDLRQQKIIGSLQCPETDSAFWSYKLLPNGDVVGLSCHYPKGYSSCKYPKPQNWPTVFINVWDIETGKIKSRFTHRRSDGTYLDDLFVLKAGLIAVVKKPRKSSKSRDIFIYKLKTGQLITSANLPETGVRSDLIPTINLVESLSDHVFAYNNGITLSLFALSVSSDLHPYRLAQLSPITSVQTSEVAENKRGEHTIGLEVLANGQLVTYTAKEMTLWTFPELAPEKKPLHLTKAPRIAL